MLPKYNEFEERLYQEGWQYIITDGVKSFTVEELASRLGVSKKTVYQKVSSKEELITNCITSAMSELFTNMQRIMRDEENPALQLIKVGEFVATFLSRINIQRIMELKMRYPGIWQKVEHFRFERREQFHSILVAAQDQGLIKADLNIEQFSFLFVQMINSVFQPEVFMQQNMGIPDMVRLFFRTITEGIFTKEGLKHV